MNKEKTVEELERQKRTGVLDVGFDPAFDFVELKFMAKWKGLMLSGRKTVTSRRRSHAAIGDHFNVFDAEFVIDDIQLLQLQEVAMHLYEAEGCISPVDFQRAWIYLHPNKGYVPDQEVFVHFFRKVV